MKLASASILTDPIALVPDCPVIAILASQSKVGVPTAPVPAWPETVILLSHLRVTVPKADVAALGAVSVTGLGSPHVSDPQVPRPQPVISARGDLSDSYNR